MSPSLVVGLLGDEAHLPYERPALSKTALVNVDIAASHAKHDARYYKDQNIDLILGTSARSLDTHTRVVALSTAEEVHFDKLILATGASVRRLGLPSDVESRLHYLRTIEDARNLSGALIRNSRAAIIGAGFIGLEVAAAARARGCEVTVFDREPHVLSRVFPPSLAKAVERFHTDNGVEFVMGTPVEIDAGSLESLCVRSSAGKRDFDVVIVGIGVTPNVELARAAGLAVDAGIIVDAFGQTSESGIFAAGEVAQHPLKNSALTVRRESWQVAENQAYAAGRSGAGAPTEDLSTPWFWSDQGEMNIQVIGDLSVSSAMIFRGEPTDSAFSAFTLKDNKVIGAVAFNSSRDLAAGRRLIEMGKSVDPAQLSDPAQSWSQILRAVPA